MARMEGAHSSSITMCKSRSGWGYYGIAGAAYSLDNRRRLWLGFSGRFIRGTTFGQPLGTGPHFETKDQWFATAVELTFRLGREGTHLSEASSKPSG